ncbi:MAG: family efflux transporter [Ramlibacter sp.]|jgi:hypothetical protein|nr:family efflux transporter [Ramlibacter sp.]
MGAAQVSGQLTVQSLRTFLVERAAGLRLGPRDPIHRAELAQGAILACQREKSSANGQQCLLRLIRVEALSACYATHTLTIITAAVGGFGIFAIAGYGIASRLDVLLIPIMFGFGTAAITVVGTNLGAGNVDRARRAALVNALFVAALVGVVGLTVATWPGAWMTWFSQDPDVLAAGARYLAIVGPVYGLTAINMELYFAGQAAGRVGWPLAATLFRFGCAAAATGWAMQGALDLDAVYGIRRSGWRRSRRLLALRVWARRQPSVADDYAKWFQARLRTLEPLLSQQQYLCAGRFTAVSLSARR